MSKTEEDWEALRQTRLTALLGCWDVLQEFYREYQNEVQLAESLAAEVVEQYIEDYQVLVGRYKIEGKIQRHRIAGLMASAIMSKRPLYLLNPNQVGANISMHNEFFAAWVALSICGDGVKKEKIAQVRSLPGWSQWFGDLTYLLRRRCDGESLTLTFATLSLLFFGNCEPSE